MTKSPIKLRSSSKAKLRATKSPSNLNEQSQLLHDQSKLRSSMHTIPAKESPTHPAPILKPNFTQESINYARSRPYNNVTLRSGSPSAVRQSPSKNLQISQQLSCSKSFHHMMIQSQHVPIRQVLVSPQKSLLYDSIARPESLVNIASPIKSGLDNQRSFMRVQLGSKVGASDARVLSKEKVGNVFVNRLQPPMATEIVTVRPKMTSSPKIVLPVVQKIHSVHSVQQPVLIENAHVLNQVSARQIELERKVKILETRIGELYAQKSQMETQMNQVNIRLQYQNNFLKEKVDELTKRLNKSSSQQQIQLDHVRSKSTLSHQASQRLIKELEKSQENEYHQSKQIHSLRQHLLETEEMLSKQINKSLSLLEELTEKEKQNEEIKEDLKNIKEKLLNSEQEFLQSSSLSKELQSSKFLLTQLNTKLEQAECQKINLSLQVSQLQACLSQAKQQNNSLLQEVAELQKKESETQVTKDLMNQLQQNNNLLITAIKSLEASLKENEIELETLKSQKAELKMHVHQMEQRMGMSQTVLEQQGSDYEREVETLARKLEEIQVELSQKNGLVSNLTLTLKQQSTQLQQREQFIKNQQTKIEQLLKSHQQGNSSTANSFHKKQSDPCTKCDQLRKTIIKLNSHLAKSSNSISSKSG